VPLSINPARVLEGRAALGPQEGFIVGDCSEVWSNRCALTAAFLPRDRSPRGEGGGGAARSSSLLSLSLSRSSAACGTKRPRPTRLLFNGRRVATRHKVPLVAGERRRAAFGNQRDVSTPADHRFRPPSPLRGKRDGLILSRRARARARARSRVQVEFSFPVSPFPPRIELSSPPPLLKINRPHYARLSALFTNPSFFLPRFLPRESFAIATAVYEADPLGL